MAQIAWVGLDVGADQSQVCITDDDGVLLSEAMVPTSARRVLDFIRSVTLDWPFSVGMETGTFAIPLAKELRKAGCEVKVFDAFQSHRFLRIRRNKTDRNDAKGLADVVRLGRAVSVTHLKGAEKQTIRAELVIRQKVVETRLALENVLRAVLRIHGGAPKPWWSPTGLRKHVASELARLRSLGTELNAEVAPLVELCAATRVYVNDVDRRLTRLARDIEICSRWMEIPGVGPLTALAFYSGIDDPARFDNLADVGPYLGLAPRVIQTGNKVWIGRVSKRGDRLLRAQLVLSAASAIRSDKDTRLRAWALKVKERRGYSRAKTALGRKLAMVMLAMWKSGEAYKAHP